MGGLKNVRNRRDDALSRVAWERLEVLLANHYRASGWAVDHVGTGATGSRFDGGIDLRLRRGDARLLVQCKHWNAKQVPHNAVHELLGITVNEGATGAILVTSGEFTRYAREVAARGGRVQLVDGDALRDMLGPLPDVPNPVPDPRSRAETVAAYVGERLLLAAEDRIRRRRRGEGPGRRAVEVTVIGFVLKAGLLVLVAWGIHAIMDGALKQAIRAPGARPQASAPSTVAPTAAMTAALPSRQVAAAPTEPYPCHEIIDWRSGTYIDHCAKPALREPTAAEIRESQRKADEAAAILAPHTPEI